MRFWGGWVRWVALAWLWWLSPSVTNSHRQLAAPKAPLTQMAAPPG
jgi:hypothetical protein